LKKGQDHLDLVDYRRRVGDLYRLRSPDALLRFRTLRDELFRTHPQSPIEDRPGFIGIDYFPPDPGFRLAGRVEWEDQPSELLVDTGGDDGVIRYHRAGALHFFFGGADHRLTLLSIAGYGGGLFLPFADATSGTTTYGGGRYLFDTIKNTDGLCLEVTPGSSAVVVDFNYAYNPSCAYSPAWACPLAPPENRLPFAVLAGERAYQPRVPGSPLNGPSTSEVIQPP
jgi:uncharacterized protein (DUF1684 family)